MHNLLLLLLFVFCFGHKKMTRKQISRVTNRTVEKERTKI